MLALVVILLLLLGWALTLRLLLIALPLSLLAAWLIGLVLLPGLSPWLLAVLATVVMSVDLLGTDVARLDRLFLGWARPRGIASVVFGLLAYIELAGPDADLVLAVMVVTVVASIVVHGLSAGPITRRYGRPDPAAPAFRASPGG